MPAGSSEVRIGVPNLEVFADTLCELAARDRNLLVVTSDSRSSGRLMGFAQRFPSQLIEVGIAEQALVGVACGLAAMGKRVFAVSPASFLTTRALEQIKNDAAYSDNPVVLVGISAGVSYGALGSTHHALHDLAALQAIPNLSIIVPADNLEARAACLAAYRHPHPVYLRFGKKALPERLGAESFTLGRIRHCLARPAHCDVALIACGEAVWPAVQAAVSLAAYDIIADVISVPTIRPLDEEGILAAIMAARCVVTVEEHSIYGGLGSRIAMLLAERGLCRPMRIVGFPDEPAIAGSQDELYAYYGLSVEKLTLTARTLLAQNPTAKP